MTDDTAARLMARMRGTAESQAPEGATKVGAAHGEVRDQLLRYSAGSVPPAGEPDEYRAALHKRARELRAQGVSYPESGARTELHMEAQARSEKESRRAVHEAMVKSNRAEMEANSTPALQDRIRQAKANRREANTKRLVAALMAQLNA